LLLIYFQFFEDFGICLRYLDIFSYFVSVLFSNHPFIESDSQMIPSKRSNHAIFIEGLPVECVETDLIKLLQTCGKVNAINMHRQPSPMLPHLRPNSVSASVEFQAREHTEQAVHLLETSVVWGRRLSAKLITPASQTSPINKNSLLGNNSLATKNTLKALRSAQVHISYLTKQMVTIVTEQMIFDLFSTFGKVTEVSLKKKCVDTEMCIQNGYGFVHFPLNSEGIESALRAVETLHQVTINNITYDCSVSNQLKQILLSTGRLPNTTGTVNAASSEFSTGNLRAINSWMEDSGHSTSSSGLSAAASGCSFISPTSTASTSSSAMRFPSLFPSTSPAHMSRGAGVSSSGSSPSMFPPVTNNLSTLHAAAVSNVTSNGNIAAGLGLLRHQNQHYPSQVHSTHNYSESGSMTGHLSLHSGVTSYPGNLSLDGSNVGQPSRGMSVSSASHLGHEELLIPPNHFGLHSIPPPQHSRAHSLHSSANHSVSSNNSHVHSSMNMSRSIPAHLNNNLSNNSNGMFPTSATSIGSGRSSHDDHSSSYVSRNSSNTNHNLSNGNSGTGGLYRQNSVGNVPLIAEDDFYMPTTPSLAQTQHISSSKLFPGVFNKWFEM
jgi:hypothetical protein